MPRPTAPRPTVAQLVYGSCTVILSTLAMLLLSQTSSGPVVALIALVGLVLGLLVAMTVPRPKQARTPSQVVASSSAPAPRRERVPVRASARQD
jgi:positive regulator of sigma E activity